MKNRADPIRARQGPGWSPEIDWGSSSLAGDIQALAEAIRSQLASGRHNLLVLGVSPRPGDTLFFGQVAAEIVEKAECSLYLVAGEPFAPPAVDYQLPGVRPSEERAGTRPDHHDSDGEREGDRRSNLPFRPTRETRKAK